MKDIDTNALGNKLREWFKHSLVSGADWSPRLFWKRSPDGETFGAPRVDAMELEICLTAMLGEVMKCAGALDALRPGRSAFLAACARSHELPYLTPR